MSTNVEIDAGKTGTEGLFARQAKWRANNPKATWAHAALRSAVKRGLVTALPCEVCGAEPADAHHDDYDRPMSVRWLCRGHHKAAHRAAKLGGA
jgi:hypothetical protein